MKRFLRSVLQRLLGLPSPKEGGRPPIGRVPQTETDAVLDAIGEVLSKHRPDLFVISGGWSLCSDEERDEDDWPKEIVNADGSTGIKYYSIWGPGLRSLKSEIALLQGIVDHLEMLARQHPELVSGDMFRREEEGSPWGVEWEPDVNLRLLGQAGVI